MLGHVSFPNNLRERWLCLFVFTEKLKDLENKTSPAVVKVKSSCIHKVSKLLFDAYEVLKFKVCLCFVFIVFEYDRSRSWSIDGSFVLRNFHTY